MAGPSPEPPPALPEKTLARTLRERDLLLLFVGSVIGSGIFLTPGLILREVHGSVSASLMVWLVGGVLSLLGALTYAELAAANPEAGGLYCYIRNAFGRLPAFLYGWCLFLVIASGTIAALGHAFARYLQEIVALSDSEATAVSLLMIAAVTAINVAGTRKSSNVQNVTTVIKAGIIVVLGAVLLGLAFAKGSAISRAPSTQMSPGSLLSGFGLAMITVLWAYEGWQFGTYSAGEVENPQRSFPRSFLLGSLLLMGLYLFAVIAYLVALGPTAAAASDAVAAEAATARLGPWAGKFIAATILISVFSSTNSVFLTAPRVFYAMAKDRLFFSTLARVHPRFGTPAAAVVALGVWSAMLALAAGFAKLANGAIFVGWIFYGLAAASIFILRRKNTSNPARPLPYRVPLYPLTPLFFVLAAAALVANAIYAAARNPQEFNHLLAALALLLLGLPAYLFWSRKTR